MELIEQLLDGELVESRFAWPDESQLIGRESQEMYRVSDTKMTKNNIVYINGKYLLVFVVNTIVERYCRATMFVAENN